MIGSFEIPVADMERDKKFYETVYDISIAVHNLEGIIMGCISNALR